MRKSEGFKKETETPGKGSKAKGSQPKVTGKDSQTKEENEDDPEEVFPKIDFTIKSPLLENTSRSTQVQPFWAVCRCGRAMSADNNMDLEMLSFKICFPNENAFFKNNFNPRYSLPQLFANMTVMKNTKKISAGEVLSLPFFSCNE